MNEQTRILIVGFMGAGKSAVARELALRLHTSMIDLDDSIAARERRTPQQLIDEDGEPAFRAAETRALADALDRSAARIIALGGGALSSGAARFLIARRDCFIIWLDAPFELCWWRIACDDSRPFARDREIAGRLYVERRELYALADHRVEVVKGMDVKTIAAGIERIVRSRIKRAEDGTSEDG
jgi:shikimate kinase